ncbi:MAG: pentapeptide repeat-containing protein [Myxococcales bacterium]|nr:pentapeptide repeat-containing protein [Myxococcales bacterium]
MEPAGKGVEEERDVVVASDTRELAYGTGGTSDGAQGKSSPSTDAMEADSGPTRLEAYNVLRNNLIEAAKHSRNLFMTHLAVHSYALIVLAGLDDKKFFERSSQQTLPIINTSVGLSWFLPTLAVLCFLVFVYWQMYLRNMWLLEAEVKKAAVGLEQEQGFVPPGGWHQYPWAAFFARIDDPVMRLGGKAFGVLQWLATPTILLICWARVQRLGGQPLHWVTEGLPYGPVFGFGYLASVWVAWRLFVRQHELSHGAPFLFRRRVWIVATLALFGFSAAVGFNNVYNPAQLGHLDAGKARLPGARLARADLAGTNFEEADLYKVNLQGADLRGANLMKTHLYKANLRGANLRGAALVDAKLHKANLYKADLAGVDLRVANLRGANFCGAKLRGANLIYADLHEAKLYRANLSHADLRNAYLRGASLLTASLFMANLRGADLCGADLRADFGFADLGFADLRVANLRGANLRGANLRGANLQDTNLHRAQLERADLRRAKSLTQAQLDTACGDADTKLPEGLTVKPCE